MSRIPYKPDTMEHAFKKLEKLYSSIPETSGCLEYISKAFEDGGCGGKCCFLQNAQVLYCEFLRTLNDIMNNWSMEEFSNIIEKSLINYLNNHPTKSCILWNEKTKLCRCHMARPLSCYLYSIEDDEEFLPKFERMKEKYKSNPFAVFMDQCHLSKTKDGSMLSKKRIEELWNELVEIEKSIGVDENNINDDFGGTYRTFHDHLLIFLLPDYMMENLSKVRQFGNQEEKNKVVSTFMNILTPLAKNMTNK